MNVTVSFSAEEAAILDEVLRDELEDTHAELRRTENQSYKEQVTRRYELLQRVLRELEPAIHAGV